MRRSDLFVPASRESPAAGTETTRLIHRVGLVRQFGSGLYGYTPVGERVRRKLQRVLATEMERVGAQRVSLPDLQPREIWEQSGRWRNFEDEMLTLETRDDQQLCLAPSHEEAVVELVDGWVRSYEDLPLVVYQVGRKYRDDHPRHGLVRTKSLTMKDAYSLHADRESLEATYREVRRAYERIFDAVGLEVAIVEADAETMGGTHSEEFVAPAGTGSDRLTHCRECRFGVTDEHGQFDAYAAGEDCPECGGPLATTDGIEVGHVFQLGTRYSESMGLTVDREDGTTERVQMGSYGIGVDRLLQTILKQHADSEGCRWPVTERGSVAPYRAAIVPLRYEGQLRQVADELHEACGREDVLLFDADRRIGERFAESDLLGIPCKVVLGNDYLETGRVELETRDGETEYVDREAVPQALERYALDAAGI